ncbi:unnamed protein product [Cuscuta europaea]|uniref:RCC1-like domain-containing protein n=2 Tax=Cuscuta europaea TaxID=41803 RepID=A0A9P0ZG20_CUSEU|nr:unnamed protein product [Cuscuta europaea]
MYGNGDGGGGEGAENQEVIKRLVYMWGYLPGATQKRSPLLSAVVVRLPGAGTLWKDVSGGGCGFAMAISDSGKLITWGSTDDLGQSYVTAGKHGEMPEPFPLPDEVSVVKASAGWAHCVVVTENGEVYTWGWKECIPSGKVIGDPSMGISIENIESEKQESLSVEPVSRGVDDGVKRRRTSSSTSFKQAAEGAPSTDEIPSALPCLVTLNQGVRVLSVAAGGRHTLALSVPDVGQVWGWGYGGEGQLGLGSRIRMVSSPQPIPFFDSSPLANDSALAISHGSTGSEGQGHAVPGIYVKGIACGGRHSAVVTDTGAVLTFGWGLYGQCGQGSTDDELSPICVSSLLGIRIDGIAAGLWHTLCVSADGDVYAFGGNQFGQLGTGEDQAETLPRLLDATCLENVNAKVVSCGARHSAIVTEDNKVFCWGWNKYGQLGLGDVIDRKIPTQVSIDGCVPKNVSCGWWHTLLLTESPT